MEAVVGSLEAGVEVIVVDDCSEDGSWELIRESVRKVGWLRALRLSRNFGQQRALLAGMVEAQGEFIFTLDLDLQDPPELVHQFLEECRAGADVCYGVRRTRSGTHPLMCLLYRGFYRILEHLADCKIPLDAGDFRMIHRRVCEEIIRFPEQQVFLRGMVSWVGFRQVALPYDRAARAAGSSKYTWAKLWQLAKEGIMSFSVKPLRLATWLALFFAGGALLLILWLVYGAFFIGTAPAGWTSLMVVVLLATAAQLLVLGIIGEYLGHIFLQTKSRPLFVIGERLGDATGSLVAKKDG
jgi:glycosyltransferase involved in cell wall biosynthesis